MNWLRYNIVLMLQLPQSFDKMDLMNNLVNSFEELKTAQFQNLPQIPDANFPVISGASQLMNINVFPVSFSFDFALKSDQNICDMIDQKIHTINSIVSNNVIGNYRIGIVITGALPNFTVYESFIKSKISIDLMPDWLETQFSIRTKKNTTILGKDRTLNLWKRFNFDRDADQGSIVIDVNTSINDFIDIRECNVETIWRQIKPMLEECIDAIQR